MAEPKVLINAEQVSFSFGSKHIFGAASWVIREGERAALVGPNGAGKTTFIKLITGRLQPDLGEISIDPSLRYGYMTQQFEFSADATVGSLVTELPPQARSIQEQLGQIETMMGDPAFYEAPGYEEVLTRYGEMQREFQQLAAKGDESAALSFLQELGLPEATLETKMRTLSGGQKTRVLLAKALANYKDMDLLILDEPTNHLDIETVEWLEDFLVERYKGALLLVAHDQYLMDNLATKILEVEDKKVWEWDGNYSTYLEQREATQRALEARRKREMDEFARQLKIIEEIKRRNRFDHQAQSKQTRLEKMKKDATHIPQASRGSFKLQLTSVQKLSNDVLVAEDLTKKFDGTTILDHANFQLQKGDRVGLIGPNGTGKTTLLRMIMNLDKPTSGQARGLARRQDRLLRPGALGPRARPHAHRRDTLHEARHGRGGGARDARALPVQGR